MIQLFKKIKINPFFWIVLSIGIMTGYFREVLIVFLIVFIHEMGHVCAALYFKWNINKIELLPFGGVVEMNETSNRPIKEEFIVILAGPAQHLWLIALSYLLLPTSFWTINDHEIFIWHNLVILLFNLLPVWPLDGGRIVHLVCSYLWAYQKAYMRSVIFSFTCLVLLTMIAHIIYPFHLNLWIVLIFLFISNYLQWKQRHFSMIRFLLDRHKRDRSSLRHRTIRCDPFMTVQQVLQLFRRDFYHTISIGRNHRIDEDVVLEKCFQKNSFHEPIAKFF